MALHRSCPRDARRFADCAVYGSEPAFHTCTSAHNQETRSQPRRPRLTEQDLANPIKILAAFDYTLREAWIHAPADAEYRNRLPFDYITERLLQMLERPNEVAEMRIMLALMNLTADNHLLQEGLDLVMPLSLRRMR